MLGTERTEEEFADEAAAMSFHRDYLLDLSLELMQLARPARQERDAAPEGSPATYPTGETEGDFKAQGLDSFVLRA